MFSELSTTTGGATANRGEAAPAAAAGPSNANRGGAAPMADMEVDPAGLWAAQTQIGMDRGGGGWELGGEEDEDTDMDLPPVC